MPKESEKLVMVGVFCLSSLASSSFLLLESDGGPEIGVTAFGVVFSGTSLDDGVVKARGVEVLTGSGSLVFNNSENDFFGPINAPNLPPIEPLKATNPSDVVGFSPVGDSDAGAKTDFGPTRAERRSKRGCTDRRSRRCSLK